MTERPHPWSSSWPATSGKDDQRSSQRVISAQLDYIAQLLEKLAGIEPEEDDHVYSDMSDGWCSRHQAYCAYEGRDGA